MAGMRFLAAAAVAATAEQTAPYPFERTLKLTSPMMSGNDVRILQALVARPASGVPAADLKQDAIFGPDTAKAVAAFREARSMGSGDFDATAAAALVDCCLLDGYQDDGLPASARGKLYKVHVPVHRNRSIETWGTLYDADNVALLRFRAHTRGQYPRNELTSNGNTPTGLMEFDLQTPEEDPQTYGPYNVNRVVSAVARDGEPQTNAEIVLGVGKPASSIRSGILLHTGNFSSWSGYEGWHVPLEMPDSHGCIHSYWENISSIADTLRQLGVEARPNTNGAMPYPYEPQGLLSVEVVDDLGEFTLV
jgi:peptidoglycan hydrolase-like protein with peptidoglycan-binding domain